MNTLLTPRRDFLKLTAAAGIAGAVLATPPFNRATPSSTAMSSSVGEIK